MNPLKTTSPYILIRRSAIHGRGIFARIDIARKTRIIEYTGQKITKAEAENQPDPQTHRHKKNRTRGTVYIFILNKRYDIDGNVAYNTARYINHSCDPNCETEIIRGKIWVIALRDIAKGEELFYNYGYDYDDYTDHRCFCRTNRCVGYILAEEHWPKLRKEIKMKGSGTTYKGRKKI